MHKLKEYFSYKKFSQFPFRFLILEKSYHLQKQIADCLQNMGHNVFILKVKDNPTEMADSLLKASVQFKPDCIFGMNHIGFDQEGKLADIISQFKIPVIFWYVDDFRFIMGENKDLIKSNVMVFSFEKNNIKQLKELGFDHVYYLPTATGLNPASSYYNTKFSFLSNAVSFIGSTFASTINQWNKSGYEGLKEFIDLENLDFSQNNVIVDYIAKHQSQNFKSKNDFYHYSGYVSAIATQIYRKKYLGNLEAQNVHIFGDEKWKDFNFNFQVHPPVDNINVSPQIFSSSAINLNISSCQLETAVNLRVFDVPASNGFLLTDWKESLAELFDVKDEIAYYHSIEEMNDKIKYYLTYPQKKEKIIQKAKQRVINEHLLNHRLEKIISIAQKVFT